MQNYYNPTVIEQTKSGERGFDLYSRLLKDRIIFLNGLVDDELSRSVIAQLLYLDMFGEEDIKLYINSPGGSVTAGLAIYDTMNLIGCNVATYGVGICASMGAFLLSSGAKGKRYMLPSSYSMIHQVSGGAYGTFSDVERTVGFMATLNEKLTTILAKNCGKKKTTMKKRVDRDTYMDANESIELGLVDKILKK